MTRYFFAAPKFMRYKCYTPYASARMRDGSDPRDKRP
jgi:hypothetical protein